jgi:hypothetical protein
VKPFCEPPASGAVCGGCKVPKDEDGRHLPFTAGLVLVTCVIFCFRVGEGKGGD